MNICVISWFFPPANSSEGLVTYKLLKHSSHEFTVLSSTSSLWGYDKSSGLKQLNNVELHSIPTNQLSIWKDFCFKEFERLHQERPFDAIMSRTMPPESIEVALKIKKKYPDIKWIASFGDPISKSPYNTQEIIDCPTLSSEEQKTILSSLEFMEPVSNLQFPFKDFLNKMKFLEEKAYEFADLIICPHETMASFMFGSGNLSKKVFILPHSFDPDLYPQQTSLHSEADGDQSKVRMVFLGSVDRFRNLNTFIEGIEQLYLKEPEVMRQLEINLIGNGLSELRDVIYNKYLQKIIKIRPSVSYVKSLELMTQADWLIHVDAYFEALENTGGSIYFAGKLADYMGTLRPIFGLTGLNSPAANIIHEAGGITANPTKKEDIKNAILNVLSAPNPRTLSSSEILYRKKFESSYISGLFDSKLENLLKKNVTELKSCPEKAERIFGNDKKILTVCIPSYNAEKYLDRVLNSLFECSHFSAMDILVVDDGSKDRTKSIAEVWAKKYPEHIRVISKVNGGHGSTINSAIPLAKGYYFRVIDADDWIDSSSMDLLIEKLIAHDFLGEGYPDLISANYKRINQEDGSASDVNRSQLGCLENDRIYKMDSTDFTDEFFSLGSLFYKTRLLQENFNELRLQEKTYYVDVEFMLYPLKYVKNFMLSDESIYRYSVGRAEQSISLSFFTRHFADHNRVMTRLSQWYKDNESYLSEPKRNYLKRIISLHFQTHAMLCLRSNSSRLISAKELEKFSHFITETNNKSLMTIWENISEVRRLKEVKGILPIFVGLNIYSESRERTRNNLRRALFSQKDRVKERVSGTSFYKPLRKSWLLIRRFIK